MAPRSGVEEADAVRCLVRSCGGYTYTHKDGCEVSTPRVDVECTFTSRARVAHVGLSVVASAYPNTGRIYINIFRV